MSEPDADTKGDNTSTMISILYRSALMGICGWVLLAVLAQNDRSIKMESDIRYFNTSVSRIEGNMSSLVTKTELELTVTKLQNEQLKFQNEFLKATQATQVVPSTKR